jgi:hypothetical protein
MAANSAISLSVARVLEDQRDSQNRYIDMQLAIECHETGERLVTLGGVWDKREKRYVGCAETEHVIRIQPAQIKAARWLCAWFRRYAQAQARKAAGDDDAAVWRGFGRAYSVLFYGGRRAGKSHLACVALVMFAVMRPCTLCWAVSPTEEQTEELRAAIASLLPARWHRYRKEEMTFTLANRARIRQRSGFNDENLKAGGLVLTGMGKRG